MFSFNEQIKGYLDLIYGKIPLLLVECGRCGRCCKAKIEVAFIEYLSIKEFIISNGIKPIYDNNGKCIFLDTTDAPTCLIHPVRPWICRVYRPYPKGERMYYVDLKKDRTTEKCGYVAAVVKNGKSVPCEEFIIPAMMIGQLQQSLKGIINIPEGFLHRDNTFIGWQQECRNYVKTAVSRNKRGQSKKLLKERQWDK